MVNAFLNSISLYRSGQFTSPCFSGIPLSSTEHNTFFPSHWLVSHIIIVEAMDSGERGMNPVAMTCHESSEKNTGQAGERTSALLGPYSPTIL